MADSSERGKSPVEYSLWLDKLATEIEVAQKTLSEVGGSEGHLNRACSLGLKLALAAAQVAQVARNIAEEETGLR